MKFHPRDAPVLFGGLPSTVMVTLVSGLLLLFREGLNTGFAVLWLNSFSTTWAVVFPTALVTAPWVRRFVASATAQEAH